jgi:hypothetical protein
MDSPPARRLIMGKTTPQRKRVSLNTVKGVGFGRTQATKNDKKFGTYNARSLYSAG